MLMKMSFIKYRQSSLKSQRSVTAATLVEEAEEATEDRAVNSEATGDTAGEEGRQTPEVVMTEAMPDPVKESPKSSKKVDKSVVPKMR